MSVSTSLQYDCCDMRMAAYCLSPDCQCAKAIIITINITINITITIAYCLFPVCQCPKVIKITITYCLLPLDYCLLPGCQCAKAIIININITIVSIHVFLIRFKNSMPTNRVKMTSKIFKVGRKFNNSTILSSMSKDIFFIEP